MPSALGGGIPFEGAERLCLFLARVHLVERRLSAGFVDDVLEGAGRSVDAMKVELTEGLAGEECTW